MYKYLLQFNCLNVIELLKLFLLILKNITPESETSGLCSEKVNLDLVIKIYIKKTTFIWFITCLALFPL